MTECNRKKLNEIGDPSIVYPIAFGVALSQVVLLIFLAFFYARILRKSNKKNIQLTRKINEILNEKDWTVYIVEKDNGVPNAFCLIYKDIYLTKSILKLLSEREIISICLHEAYHIKNKHTFKKIISKYPIFGILLSVVFTLNIPSVFIIPLLYVIMIRILSIPLDIIMGRKMELNSDSYAVKYGYGNEIKNSLEKLYKELYKMNSKESCGTFCQIMNKVDEKIREHPPLKKRIENILRQKEIYKNENLDISKARKVVSKEFKDIVEKGEK